MTEIEALPRAGRREWIGLAVLALACLLYVMDLTVLHLAIPAISADLEPTSAQLLWIIDIYGFFVAGSLITMGTLGDRIGRRKLLMIGASAFGAVSLLAAFSPNAESLIAARALLGLAGATLAPSTLSLIFHMFQDPRQRSVAIGFWIGSFSAGSAIGPVLGGVMLELFWWGSVFLLALPVMAALLILGPRVLPEYRDPDAGRLDLLTAGMSVAAILAVIYGLKEIAQDGVNAARRGDVTGLGSRWPLCPSAAPGNPMTTWACSGCASAPPGDQLPGHLVASATSCSSPSISAGGGLSPLEAEEGSCTTWAAWGSAAAWPWPRPGWACWPRSASTAGWLPWSPGRWSSPWAWPRCSG